MVTVVEGVEVVVVVVVVVCGVTLNVKKRVTELETDEIIVVLDPGPIVEVVVNVVIGKVVDAVAVVVIVSPPFEKTDGTAMYAIDKPIATVRAK